MKADGKTIEITQKQPSYYPNYDAINWGDKKTCKTCLHFEDIKNKKCLNCCDFDYEYWEPKNKK